MSQLWTIIFFAILAIAFGLAYWHDHDKAKRQEQKRSAHEKLGNAED
jgi:uncharacterized membrane protein YidH (DUF202 family)